MESGPAITVDGLTFSYDGPKILENLSLTLPRGSRCLLVGANGTGKTTLLRVLAGKHIHDPEKVVVLGRPAYFETPSNLTFLGGEWARNPQVCRDVTVTALIESMERVHPVDAARRDYLLDLLDINIDWHMHQVSDGERRRVQLLLGLLKPFELLLLDEVTVDLDVVVRHDLLEFLQDETDKRGATIIYATHIFDGLNEWATHIAHLSQKRIVRLQKVEDIRELELLKQDRQTYNSPLLALVEHWLRADFNEKRKQSVMPKPGLLDKLAENPHSDRFFNYWK